MSDWNTLHFFDDKRFYDTVVPDLRGKGVLLKHYLESTIGRYTLGDNSNSEARINSMLKLCSGMDPDFKVHAALHELETREKQLGENYHVLIQERHPTYDEFMQIHQYVLEDFERMFILLVFAECACFNPHLMLGPRIFSACIAAEPRTISEEVYGTLMTRRKAGGIFNCYGSGVMNWLPNEELQMLWLDRHHLKPVDGEAESYFNEFLQFVKIALENKQGLIAVTNVKEDVLNSIPMPVVQINLDVKEQDFRNIIIYPNKVFTGSL